MTDVDIWRLFASLGVPGLALGVFYMLFRVFKWDFPRVPKSWVGPLIVLFMLLTSGVVFYTIHRWAPPPGDSASPDSVTSPDSSALTPATAPHPSESGTREAETHEGEATQIPTLSRQLQAVSPPEAVSSKVTEFITIGIDVTMLNTEADITIKVENEVRMKGRPGSDGRMYVQVPVELRNKGVVGIELEFDGHEVHQFVTLKGKRTYFAVSFQKPTAATVTAEELRRDKPPDTVYTYQGGLRLNGNLVTDFFGMRFRLYDGPDKDTSIQVGRDIQRCGVLVSKGLFSTDLDFGSGLVRVTEGSFSTNFDFGSAFDNTALYVEISVASAGLCDSTAEWADLAPLQPLNVVREAQIIDREVGKQLDPNSHGEATPAGSGVAENISAYVLAFTTRQGEQTDLTESLTREFEEAITALDSHFTILNGRDPNRFINHRQNVNKIQTLASASQALLADMKAFQVDQVIFGEVHDDVASGELILTITFETLEGIKVLINSGTMKLGLQTDRATRVTMVQQIVAALAARTRTVNRQISAGYIFALIECNRASRTITCTFTITNNDEDRYLQVYSRGNGTRLFDDQGNQLVPMRNDTSVTLANQTRNESYGTKAFLLASIPTPLTIAFDKASTSATKIVRVDLSCWESDHDKRFIVTFRNIQITQG